MVQRAPSVAGDMVETLQAPHHISTNEQLEVEIPRCPNCFKCIYDIVVDI